MLDSALRTNLTGIKSAGRLERENMSRIKRYHISLLASTVILNNLFLLSALAAPGENQNNLWGLNTRKNSKDSFNHQALKEQPNLPQLPTYSTKTKLLRGFVHTNDHGWVVYSITTLAKEEPSQVTHWYKNAFILYQWKILHSGLSDIIGRQQDGSLCTVAVNPSTEPGYKSSMSMTYSIAPTKTVPSQCQ